MGKINEKARKLSLTEVLKNLDKLHTTELGVERIKRNLFLDTDDVVGWCKAKIDSVKAVITRSGKNWYSDAHAQAYEDWLGGIKGVQVPYDQCGQMVMVTPAFPKGSMLIIMSVLGAVVMPHNLFLHSEVIQSHEYNTRSSTAPGAGQPEVPAGNYEIKGISAKPRGAGLRPMMVVARRAPSYETKQISASSYMPLARSAGGSGRSARR